MTRVISASMTACALVLATMAPVTAAPLPPSVGVPTGPTGAQVVPTQYEGATTGAHHGRRNRASGEVSKSVEPSHADLHGATRESADKAYRKQYGF